MSMISLKIYPILHKEFVSSLRFDSGEEYYIAFWISNPFKENMGGDDLFSVPFVNIQSNSTSFVHGFVSDLVYVYKNDPEGNKNLFSHFCCTKEPITLQIIPSDSTHSSSSSYIEACSAIRLCYTIYQKESFQSLNDLIYMKRKGKSNLFINNDIVIDGNEDKNDDTNSSKLVTGSFCFADSLHTILEQEERFFLHSVPLGDYATKLELNRPNSHQGIDKNDTKNGEEEESDVFTWELGKMSLLFEIEKNHNVTQLMCINSDYVCNMIQSNQVNSSQKGKLSMCMEAVFNNLFYMHNHETYYRDFINTCIPHLFGSNQIASQWMSAFLDTIHHTQKRNIVSLDNEINSSSTNPKEGILLSLFKESREYIISEWLRLCNATNDYIKEIKSIFSTKTGVFTLNQNISLKPDVISLRNFRRFYWIIDTVRIPYPHYTKLCLPEINLPITSIYDEYVIRNQHIAAEKMCINDDCEKLFLAMLELSCIKHGFQQNMQDFLSTIEEAYCITFCDTHSNSYENKTQFGNKKGGETNRPFAWCKVNNQTTRKEDYTKRGTLSHYKLIKCVEVLGDFLCSVSCAMDYRFDTRLKRGLYDNTNVASEDVDTLDFDGISGLNEEGDCDEKGIFIDYIYSILCNGRKRDHTNGTSQKRQNNFYRPWDSTYLNALTFLAIQYIDLCMFGTVDDPKLETNIGNDQDEVSAQYGDNSESNPKKKRRKSSDREENINYLYNEYDSKDRCDIGHTFVILIPIVDFAEVYLDEFKNEQTKMNTSVKKKYDEFMSDKVIGIDKQSMAKTFKHTINRIYHYLDQDSEELSQQDDELKEHVRKVASLLPRLLLEGTARQSSLQMEMDQYYGDKSTFAQAERKRKVFLEMILDTEKGQLNHPLLNCMEVCSYQDFDSNYYDSHMKVKSKYEDRKVDFYRRGVNCTSQMLRSIMSFYFYDNKAIQFIWDNMIWINPIKRTWGVPIRYILDADKKEHALCVPVSLECYKNYTYTNTNTTKQNQKDIYDIFENAKLYSRIPKPNFEYLTLPKSQIINVVDQNEGHKNKKSVGEYMSNMTYTRITEFIEKLEHDIMVFMSLKLHHGAITDEELNNVIVYIKALCSNVTNLNANIIRHKTLPWFGDELTIIFYS